MVVSKSTRNRFCAGADVQRIFGPRTQPSDYNLSDRKDKRFNVSAQTIIAAQKKLLSLDNFSVEVFGPCDDSPP